MDPLNRVFQGLDIAASGLTAELRRAEVVAANIANMHVTGGPGREPYRRQGVVFEEVLAAEQRRGALARPQRTASGVRVQRVYQDRETPFQMRHMPGHPDADASGWVRVSNVDLFREMVDMTAIERGFEANLAAMRSYRGMLSDTITNIGRS